MNIQNELNAFMSWCEVFSNSPDIINLRWWDVNRRQAFYAAEEENRIISAIGKLTEHPISVQSDAQPERIPVNQNNHGSDNDMANKPHKRNAKGRPAADKLIKTLDPTTLQGRIVEFILKDPAHKQIDKVLDNFMLDRHPFLTTLNVIARNTGIGYQVLNEEVILTLPPGVIDPFDL